MQDETEPTDRPMICGVCGYPLERSDDPEIFGGAQWGHIRPDMLDHVVVPVDPAEIDFKSRCDFCDREEATDVVLAESFQLPNTPSRSIGHWAAC